MKCTMYVLFALVCANAALTHYVSILMPVCALNAKTRYDIFRDAI